MESTITIDGSISCQHIGDDGEKQPSKALKITFDWSICCQHIGDDDDGNNKAKQ